MSTPNQSKVGCHSGNTRVLLSSNAGSKSEAGLYLGGWSRGAVKSGFHVIDLTGAEEHSVSLFQVFDKASRDIWGTALSAGADSAKPASWMSFKIKDYGVPSATREQWQALADNILNLINAGGKVLVACQGGHGRTGMAGAIICGLLASLPDPIQYIRESYCVNTVETAEQHKYVHRMLNLPVPTEEVLKQYVKVATITYGTGWNGAYQDKWWEKDDYPLSKKTSAKHEKDVIYQIIQELDMEGIWCDVPDLDNPKFVIVMRKPMNQTIKLVDTKDKTGYLLESNEIVDRAELMTEKEYDDWKAQDEHKSVQA